MTFLMKIIIIVIGMITVIATAALYYVYRSHEKQKSADTTVPSQEALESHLRGQVEKAFQRRLLQAQMAVFDDMLKTDPNNSIAKQKKAELQSQIDTLQ